MQITCQEEKNVSVISKYTHFSILLTLQVNLSCIAVHINETEHSVSRTRRFSTANIKAYNCSRSWASSFHISS